uniref:Putative secreted protein n=1 Tax=Amblyomma triste TaxID=251400 RepID=A0A023G1A0_AMBTT
MKTYYYIVYLLISLQCLVDRWYGTLRMCIIQETVKENTFLLPCSFSLRRLFALWCRFYRVRRKCFFFFFVSTNRHASAMYFVLSTLYTRLL